MPVTCGLLPVCSLTLQKVDAGQGDASLSRAERAIQQKAWYDSHTYRSWVCSHYFISTTAMLYVTVGRLQGLRVAIDAVVENVPLWLEWTRQVRPTHPHTRTWPVTIEVSLWHGVV